MTKETKLIGYRKLKSFRFTATGPSDLELGSFSVWARACLQDSEPAYKIWLDLDKLPATTQGLDDSSETADTEEGAKQIVLDHIGDSSVSRLWIPHAGAFMSYTGAFSSLLPLHQSELLHLMEVRI